MRVFLCPWVILISWHANVHFAFGGPRPCTSRKASSRSGTQGPALAEPAEPGVSCGPSSSSSPSWSSSSCSAGSQASSDNSFSLVTVSGANYGTFSCSAFAAASISGPVGPNTGCRCFHACVEAVSSWPNSMHAVEIQRITVRFVLVLEKSSDFNKSCSSE